MPAKKNRGKKVVTQPTNTSVEEESKEEIAKSEVNESEVSNDVAQSESIQAKMESPVIVQEPAQLAKAEMIDEQKAEKEPVKSEESGNLADIPENPTSKPETFEQMIAISPDV